MDAVAIGAGGHINVAFFGQGRAVDAVLICFVDGLVAGGAGLGYASPRLVWLDHVVSAVAIGADGGVCVPLAEDLEVDAVQSARVVGKVAAAAHVVPRQGVVPGRL